MAWVRKQCSLWSWPYSPSWSCRDAGKRWSVVFLEERRWLERCSQAPSVSHYLHMRGEEVRQVFETLEEGKCVRVCNLPWALSCTGIWFALRELTKRLRDPPAAFTRGQTQSLTVLQFLVDDYDQLSFGLAVRGPCVARTAAAVDEVFADVHRWARHRDGGLARQGVLLVQQRRLVLPRPNVGSWHHVHSHADHKNEASVCGPVLWVQPVWDTWEQESGINHINTQSPHSSLCSGMVEKCLGWGEEPEWRARCMFLMKFWENKEKYVT